MSIHRPFESLLLPILLPTRWSVSVPITLTTSFSHANLQKVIADIEHEWETVWDVFPNLSKNPIAKRATIPPSTSSSGNTNISSTNYHTLSSIACTSNSHNHSHTTDHLYHINTITPTPTSITTLKLIIFPKQPHLKKTKIPARNTSALSTTTTSATTSISISVATIFIKKLHSKRTKQSTQVTLSKRHAPILS